MNKTTIAILAFVPLSANAAPFLYADPPQTVTHCGYQIDGGSRADTPVVTESGTKYCKVDLSGVPVGSHVVNLTSVIVDPVWGRQESVPSANFTFVRPALPAVPAGLVLKP